MSPRESKPYRHDEDPVEEVETKIEPTFSKAKEEVKVEEKSTEASPLILTSKVDAYILERQKAQSKDLGKIMVKEVQEFKEGVHRLELPPEVKLAMQQKNCSPRWINKHPHAIAHALDVVGWSLVNQFLFPELPKHLFTASGSIERGDAILGFMSSKRAEQIRLRPAEISRKRVEEVPVQNLKKWKQREEHHYKPKSGVSEKTGEEVSVPQGITVQPDTEKSINEE